MHPLLEKLFHKRGIEDVTKLAVAEKEQFDKWQKILSEGEMTIDRLKLFCESQITLIQEQWKNLDNDAKKNERLIMLHNVYTTMLNVISSPQTERLALERYLNNLLE